ncbi:hypothetical protein MRX96_028494 [Rhipicephalus microplus]
MGGVLYDETKRIKGELVHNQISCGKLHNSYLFRKSKVGWFLRKPNWQNIQLQPFEKNIYEEHRATASRSMTEESNFPDGVVRGIDALRNYTSLTSIEANCRPVALSCQNFLGIAEAGLRKKLAYVLPAVIQVRQQPARQRLEGPIAVLFAPMRELAKRIHVVASELGEHAATRSVCATNGERKKVKFAEHRGGCDILMTMPRCLIDFLEEGVVNLYRRTYLVFDEVDRMLL